MRPSWCKRKMVLTRYNTSTTTYTETEMKLYYSDVAWAAMTIKITVKSTFCSTVCLDSNKGNTEDAHCWPLRWVPTQITWTDPSRRFTDVTAQRANNAESVSMAWRHHDFDKIFITGCNDRCQNAGAANIAKFAKIDDYNISISVHQAV